MCKVYTFNKWSIRLHKVGQINFNTNLLNFFFISKSHRNLYPGMQMHSQTNAFRKTTKNIFQIQKGKKDLNQAHNMVHGQGMLLLIPYSPLPKSISSTLGHSQCIKGNYGLGWQNTTHFMYKVWRIVQGFYYNLKESYFYHSVFVKINKKKRVDFEILSEKSMKKLSFCVWTLSAVARQWWCQFSQERESQWFPLNNSILYQTKL